MEIKIKIDDKEYSLDEVRKLYETLRGIFQSKSANQDQVDQLRQQFYKQKEIEVSPWDNSFPKYPYQPLPQPNIPKFYNYEVTCGTQLEPTFTKTN